MHEQLDSVNDFNTVQIFTKEIPGKRAILGLATGQRAFAFRGAKIFNSLPKVIRHTESLSGFKERFLRIFLIHRS